MMIEECRGIHPCIVSPNHLRGAFTLIIIFFLFNGCKPSTQKKVPATDIENLTIAQFPQAWEGKWKGTLVISKPNGDTTLVPMQLHILPMDTVGKWDYKIIYGKESTGTRPYELHTVDASKGHYLIDEKNSILLDAYYLGDTFYSRFSVGKFLLSTRTSLLGDQLVYEIISGNKEPINSTGGVSDEIPEVESFAIAVQQKALLSRFVE